MMECIDLSMCSTHNCQYDLTETESCLGDSFIVTKGIEHSQIEPS